MEKLTDLVAQLLVLTGGSTVIRQDLRCCRALSLQPVPQRVGVGTLLVSTSATLSVCVRTCEHTAKLAHCSFIFVWL